MIPDDFRATLQTLLGGLWFPSETDCPWVLLEASDPRCELLSQLGESSVPPDWPQSVPNQELSLEAFLTEVERRSRGYGQVGRENLQRHRDLVQFLRNSCDGIRVFRAGQGRVAIFLVAVVGERSWVLYTESIET